MASDPLFFEAFIHRLAPKFSVQNPWSAHRVLGLPLRPLCLWHLNLFETIESPMLDRRRTPEPIDLRRAVAICRNRFREGRVREHFRPGDVWRLAGRGFEAHMRLFKDYVEDFLQRPDYTLVERNGGSAPRAPVCEPPETLRVVSDIIGWAHWPDWRVWELPIGEAYWYQAMIERLRLAQAGGELSFMDKEERDFQAQLKRSGFQSPEMPEGI